MGYGVAPVHLRHLPAKNERETIHANLLYGDCHMPMTKYENQSLTHKVFQLEECWFVNCTLVECTIFYAGGSYTWENSHFQNCQWKFQGQAQLTIVLLQQLGLVPQPQAGLAVSKTSPAGPVN